MVRRITNSYTKIFSWQKNCRQCWMTFKPKTSTQKFCSRNCSDLAKTKQEKRATCNFCSKPFTYPPQGQYEQKYCSRECTNRYLKPIDCANCGKKFFPTYAKQYLCSARCRHKYVGSTSHKIDLLLRGIAQFEVEAQPDASK